MIFYSPDQAINTPYLSCISWSGPHQTRGIDLNLPDGFRAAVTLGPGITKDTLVQACMRMRKLGRGRR